MREFILEIYEMTKAEFFLANYEFVRTTPKVHTITWDFVVIDEVHKLKGGANSNGPTKIWEATKKICHKARFNIFLSGTPMVNKPEEMWAYLHIFAPDRFPNLRQFENQFTVMRRVGFEYKMTVDADRILRQALKGQMIRRDAEEVGLQLPGLTRQVVDLQMNPQQREIYDQIKNNMFLWLDQNQETPLTVMAMIALFTRFRQINTWPAGIKIKDLITERDIHLEVEDSSKVDETMDIIEDAQDNVVVFCTLNEPMLEVKRRVEAMGLICKTITGETKDIGIIEQQFQQGEINVLCVNSAMGEGLNLQKSENWPGGARICVLMDLWWSPARNEQCIARIWRQGQTQACVAYILHNEDSIDNFILAKLMEKQASFDSIMESKEIRPASSWREDLEGLL
jgi:SNF2 family DNA or RNA helicase